MVRDAIGTLPCPAGIAPAGIQLCLSAIGQADCASGLDDLAKIRECRGDSMCAKP
jgi:hypothetical protein